MAGQAIASTKADSKDIMKEVRQEQHRQNLVVGVQAELQGLKQHSLKAWFRAHHLSLGDCRTRRKEGTMVP